MQNRTPVWKRLLMFLYYHEPVWNFFSKGIPGYIKEDHPFCTKLDLSVHSVEAALDFLIKQDLIKIEAGDSKHYLLTKNGLEVAMQIESHQDTTRSDQNNLNAQFLIMVFTANAFVTTAMDFAVRNGITDPRISFGVLISFVIGTAMMLFVYLLSQIKRSYEDKLTDDTDLTSSIKSSPKKFWKRVKTSAKLSTMFAISWWATELYDQTLREGGHWYHPIGAWATIVVVLLIFGRSFLDAIEKD